MKGGQRDRRSEKAIGAHEFWSVGECVLCVMERRRENGKTLAEESSARIEVDEHVAEGLTLRSIRIGDSGDEPEVGRGSVDSREGRESGGREKMPEDGREERREELPEYKDDGLELEWRGERKEYVL